MKTGCISGFGFSFLHVEYMKYVLAVVLVQAEPRTNWTQAKHRPYSLCL